MFVVITWDERKRMSNLDKHGLDFADVTVEFMARSTIVPTKLRRFLAVGLFEGAYVTVVFATRGESDISIISMRPASKKERALAS